MKRSFSVHRVFPLGDYKNVQFTNSVEYSEGEEVPPAAEVYDSLIQEIYSAFFDHANAVMLMESVKTLKEKEEVWNARRS